jgi:hypothetical protein
MNVDPTSRAIRPGRSPCASSYGDGSHLAVQDPQQQTELLKWLTGRRGRGSLVHHSFCDLGLSGEL